MNRLLLLDGNALLHRAYHALPPLTTPTGQPAGAIYGFISMVLRLQVDLHPQGFIATFDRPGPTFRKKLFKDYQSQRPPMDVELVSQIQTVHDAMSAFNIPVFEMDGFEADDVIGTLVSRISYKVSGIDQIIIVTGDRDILQLVEDEKVLLYMPVKGLSEAKLYGEKEVVERLGVLPKLIPDWKALAGDSSDNYPGVPGIGPKTATDLVNTYGSIEKLYESLETAKISARVKEKLLAGKESAFMSKDLATIRTNAPITLDETQFAIETFDTPEVRAILTELGFGSLLKRLKTLGGIEVSGGETEQTKKKEKKESAQMDLF